MDFDAKIQNLGMQLNEANKDVIIQDRILGQARERLAELQGRINMLVELQQEEKVTLAGKSKKEAKKPLKNVRPK